MFAHLNPHSSDFGDSCALYSPFLHQLTMQSSLFEPGGLRPCPSYSRCRDRINLGLLRSLYKGGGYISGDMCMMARLPPGTCASKPRAVPGRAVLQKNNVASPPHLSFVVFFLCFCAIPCFSRKGCGSPTAGRLADSSRWSTDGSWPVTDSSYWSTGNLLRRCRRTRVQQLFSCLASRTAVRDVGLHF